jgi:hypothetical protein
MIAAIAMPARGPEWNLMAGARLDEGSMARLFLRAVASTRDRTSKRAIIAHTENQKWQIFNRSMSLGWSMRFKPNLSPR